MGLIQLFVEVKNGPDDDFFTDPTGLETTSPLSPCPDDGEDADKEEDEGGEDEDEDEDEEDLDRGSRCDEDDEDEGEDDDESDQEDDDGDEGGEDYDDNEDEAEQTHRPYRFTADPTLGVDGRRVAALGQNATYADVLLTRQFRTCVFSLSVSGRFVRFLRWDREGVTVSQAVDYKADPMPLATFLWALATSSDARRGWDTSAQPSHDPKDEALFRDKITDHVLSQLNMQRDNPRLVDKVNEHYEEKVITKLLVPSAEHEGELIQVLVSRPCFTSSSPTGRSTRGYWGVVVKETPQESEVVFVKDVWRSNVKGVECEGNILRRLHEKGVRNIPPLVAHGDVKDNGESFYKSFISSLTKVDAGVVQTTDTDQLVRRRWVTSLTTEESSEIHSRVHYRLVTRKAGYPLKTFAGSKELLMGTYDAYIGRVPCLSAAFY
jgi:hypothetical protein